MTSNNIFNIHFTRQILFFKEKKINNINKGQNHIKYKRGGFMAISNFTLNRIYLDYKNELEGVKISKIVKISDYDFSFILFSNKQKS